MEKIRNSGSSPIPTCSTRLVCAGITADGGVGRRNRRRVLGLGRPVTARPEEWRRPRQLDDRAHRRLDPWTQVRTRRGVLQASPTSLRRQHWQRASQRRLVSQRRKSTIHLVQTRLFGTGPLQKSLTQRSSMQHRQRQRHDGHLRWPRTRLLSLE